MYQLVRRLLCKLGWHYWICMRPPHSGRWCFICGQVGDGGSESARQAALTIRDGWLADSRPRKEPDGGS